jgi:hypothetical protein
MPQAHHCPTDPPPIWCQTYLLHALQEDTPTIQFSSVANLKRTVQKILDRGESEYVVVQNVSYEAFLRIADDKPSILFHKRKLYLHDVHTLRIKMGLNPHGTAIKCFNNMLLLNKLGPMGIDYQGLGGKASARQRLDGVNKEPDDSWGSHGVDYHTCVLEVGVSESARHLALDAHLWVESPESKVTQVVTIKVHPKRPEIVFQKWEKVELAYGGTRSRHPAQAQKVEEVRASLVNNLPTAAGGLSLSFESSSSVLRIRAPPRRTSYSQQQT